MITIEIIAVGKIKEDYLKRAISDYTARLSRYCKIKITEVADFPDDKNSARREGDLIKPKLKGFCIPLCIEGEQLSSQRFAEVISRCAAGGQSHITFVIGGSCGLSDDVKGAGALRLSFSKMTFPHRIARLMLLEQIYRSFKILNGERYHK